MQASALVKSGVSCCCSSSGFQNRRVLGESGRRLGLGKLRMTERSGFCGLSFGSEIMETEMRRVRLGFDGVSRSSANYKSLKTHAYGTLSISTLLDSISIFV